ncbi:MAG: type II toxin-antitoxin system VapC family toxin [Thermofilaceae archaeon]
MDTSVIVAFIDENDANHGKAVEMLNQLEGYWKVTSELVLVELASVFSQAGFSEPVELAFYSVRRSGAQRASIDFSRVIRTALLYSRELKLRTLDLLHVASCRTIGATVFATLDRELARRKNAIANLLGIEVLHQLSG